MVLTLEMTHLRVHLIAMLAGRVTTARLLLPPIMRSQLHAPRVLTLVPLITTKRPSALPALLVWSALTLVQEPWRLV